MTKPKHSLSKGDEDTSDLPEEATYNDSEQSGPPWGSLAGATHERMGGERFYNTMVLRVPHHFSSAFVFFVSSSKSMHDGSFLDSR